jgi:hypothetical protein
MLTIKCCSELRVVSAPYPELTNCKTFATSCMYMLYYVMTHISITSDRLCGLVVRVLGYRSGGPGSIPGTTKKK